VGGTAGVATGAAVGVGVGAGVDVTTGVPCVSPAVPEPPQPTAAPNSTTAKNEVNHFVWLMAIVRSGKTFGRPPQPAKLDP
jgi:hypothetical protein